MMVHQTFTVMRLTSYLYVITIMLMASCKCSCRDSNRISPKEMDTPDNEKIEQEDAFSFVSDSVLRDSLNRFLLLSASLYEDTDRLTRIMLLMKESHDKKSVHVSRSIHFPVPVHAFKHVTGKETTGYDVIVYYDSPLLIDTTVLNEDLVHTLIDKDPDDGYEALSIWQAFHEEADGKWHSEGIRASSWMRPKASVPSAPIAR